MTQCCESSKERCYKCETSEETIQFSSEGGNVPNQRGQCPTIGQNKIQHMLGWTALKSLIFKKTLSGDHPKNHLHSMLTHHFLLYMQKQFLFLIVIWHILTWPGNPAAMWAHSEGSYAGLTLAVCRIHGAWYVRSRLHHWVLWRHARILGRHRVTNGWILWGANWFTISIVHGLNRVAGHGDLLSCGLKKIAQLRRKIHTSWSSA